MHRQMNRRLIWPVAALFLLALYMVLVADLPTALPASAYDDDLFIKQALSIKKGLWLGENYNQFTLIKGPFHSVQLAVAGFLGVSPAFWLRCLYALAALLFCSLSLPAAADWMRVSAFACLLFDPWLTSTYGGLRLLREATYIPFEILALTSSLFAFDQLRRADCSQQLLNWKTGGSFATSGFFFGLLVITREARIVVFLIAGITIILLGLSLLRQRFASKKSWLHLGTLIVVFVALLSAPLSAVRLANGYHYGYSISNEFEDGGFKGFYQDLISVKLPGDSYKPWIPINQSALDKLRHLAPDTTLARTISHLNPGWKEPGCGLRPDACGEYAGGWLMWAWRSAVFNAYATESPGEFQDVINRSHRELISVCQQYPAALDCSRAASGYLTWPSRWGEPQGAGSAFFSALGKHAQGLFMVDRIRKPFKYGPITDQIKASKRLGVRLPPRDPARLQALNRRVTHLRFTGGLIRWMMVVLASILLLQKWRQLPKIFVDPGCWLLAVFGSLQLLVLVLVQVSSFESTLYLTMVSPLLSMLIWRMIAVIQPKPSASKPVLL